MRDRYAEYKDCISPSFGKIPAHWREIRTGFLFDFGRGMSISRSDMSDDGKVPCIHYGDIHGKYGFEINPMMADIGYLPQEALDTFKQVVIGYGDFLFVGTSEDIDGSGNFTYINTNCKAIAGSDTIVLRPIKPIKHRYMAYLFDSDSYREQIRALVYGIKVFHPTQSIIKNAWCILPPIHEQEKIITHLDYQTKQIDKIVDSLDTQRKKFTRYKRDLIAECVTKGLNKAAPMRPSGEDWIGDVPEHWKITKLKWMFEIVKRIYGKEDRDVLAITQQGIKIKDMESNKGQYAESYATYQVVNVNDFAMNSMDLLTGWVDCSLYEGVTSPDYRVFRFYEDKPQCHAYFKYLFQMCYTNRIFYRLGQGVSNLGRWRLQTEQFRNIKLPHPPVEEQERIAAYLDEKIRQIDAVVENITSQIQKLKDYRRILIHDAVTGKIKI